MKKLLEILRKLLGSSKSSDQNKGFTLIELLIVIAILGILAAGLLVALDPAERIRSASDAAAASKVTSAASKIEQWTITKGSGTPAVPGTIPTAADLTAAANSIDLPQDSGGYTYDYYPDATNNVFVVAVSGLTSKKAKGALGGAQNVDRFMYSSANGKSCYRRSTAAAITSATLCP
jgi:prepilin-type N-terminal cleavage/methylation domain-containing protein